MKKIIFFLSLIGVISLSHQVHAGTIFDYGSSWGYYQTRDNIEYAWQYSSEFYSATYNSFDWVKIQATGNGAFGNSNNSTYWNANTGMALQKEFVINGTISDATLWYGTDNGLIVFINGNYIFRLNEEGSGYRDEHSIVLASSFFNHGDNLIQVLAEDHGGGTWIDLKLTGTVTPSSQVPEPTTMLLIGLGLASLVGIRRKIA